MGFCVQTWYFMVKFGPSKTFFHFTAKIGGGVRPRRKNVIFFNPSNNHKEQGGAFRADQAKEKEGEKEVQTCN